MGVEPPCACGRPTLKASFGDTRFARLVPPASGIVRRRRSDDVAETECRGPPSYCNGPRSAIAGGAPHFHEMSSLGASGRIAKVGARYVLVMKDETFFPERRNLRVAFANKATGPYGPASPAFTDLHTEGPSILRTAGWWYVYYDEYTRGRYGAVRTKDFVTFDAYRDSLRTPRGIRHGSAFLAPKDVLKGLLALDAAK